MELVYTYIKGQGWVLSQANIVKDRNGRDIAYEIRKPALNEPWFRIRRTSNILYKDIPFLKNGQPNHAAIAAHVGSYDINQFAGFNQYEKFVEAEWFYITLIPL